MLEASSSTSPRRGSMSGGMAAMAIGACGGYRAPPSCDWRTDLYAQQGVKAAAGGRAEHVDDDGQDRERARTLNHRNDNVTGVLF